MGGVDCRNPEPGGEHAVEGGWGAATLGVAEDDRARLEPGSLLDLALEPLADATEADMSELVLLAVGHRHRPFLGHGSLGHHHDREDAAARVTTADQPADVVDLERALGDQDHIGAAGEARVERDPPCVATHDLDHHHPVVRLGGRVEAVDRLGRDVEGGVEAEGHVGCGEVVVDRLRHAQHRQPVAFVQAGGDAERVLAADRDQPVEVERLHRLADPFGPVLALERVGAGGAEDGPAARQDAARRLDRQLLVQVLERPPPAVAKADDCVPVVIDALADDGADRGVEAGTVTASREHTNTHARTIPSGVSHNVVPETGCNVVGGPTESQTRDWVSGGRLAPRSGTGTARARPPPGRQRPAAPRTTARRR